MSASMQSDSSGGDLLRSERIHAAALGLWLGVLGLAGASAAIIFPTMKTLAPKLEAYPNFTGEHWKLAAGIVQARIFTAMDVACVAMALVAVVSVINTWMRSDFSGTLARTRGAVIAVACVALGYQLFVLGPVMSQNVRSYWAAAAAGDNVRAEQARVAFETDHPVASRTLGIQFAGVAASLALGLAHKPRVRRGA